LRSLFTDSDCRNDQNWENFAQYKRRKKEQGKYNNIKRVLFIKN